MMTLPKLILTDIDGVWTDGGMYYDAASNEMKKFNTSDSAGVLFARYFNIEVGIITGEKTQIVTNRASKLKIELVHQGVRNKFEVVSRVLEDRGLDWNDLAYIGDDINDVLVLQHAGISACPASAPSYIKQIVKHPLNLAGGQGVFREFVELIIEKSGNWDRLHQDILNGSLFKNEK